MFSISIKLGRVFRMNWKICAQPNSLNNETSKLRINSLIKERFEERWKIKECVVDSELDLSQKELRIYYILTIESRE